jgi:hypothetical protein
VVVREHFEVRKAAAFNDMVGLVAGGTRRRPDVPMTGLKYYGIFF